MLPRVDLIRGDELSYLLLNSPDHITQFIKQNGFWGNTEAVMCKTLLTDLKNPVVIDAGANLGGFTLPIANYLQGLGGSIYSFEPQRIVFQQLCANIFLNRLDNAYVHNVALGECDTLIEIPELDYSNSQNIEGFSIDANFRKHVDDDAKADNTFRNQLDNSRSQQVRQIKLDSLDIPQSIAFIKIDIEGMELEFFKGAANTIVGNNFPPIFFEVWDRPWYAEKAMQTKNHLISLGYELSVFGREIIAQHEAYPRYLDIQQSGTNVNINLKLRA
jgi:FkbM family methyltransferase